MNRLLGFIFGGFITGLATAVFFFGIRFLQLIRRIPRTLLRHADWEIPNLLVKMDWRHYMESQFRAKTGKVLERPFGTPLHFFDWSNLQFSPNYLNAASLQTDSAVDTEVIIGPMARKPLRLKIPLMLGGISYGNAFSLKAKTSMALASTGAGTATNSGNGPFLPEERQNAERYILQYSRGFWSKSEAILRETDMIEVALGHGAWDSAPVRITGRKINRNLGDRMESIPGLDVLIESRHFNVNDTHEWRQLIAKLKEDSGGVPIGVKIGLTHHLEKELEFIVTGEIDAVVIDGMEGGSHGCPPILLDDVGLPILPGLCRTVRYLESRNMTGRISVIAGGGLVTPGDFAKCLALGADAIIIGTIAALTMSHTQVIKSIPWEPPTGLLFFDGKEAKKFDPVTGAKNLQYFFKSCVLEMQTLAGILGRNSLSALSRDDLVALDPLYAKMARVRYLQEKSSQN